MRSWSLIGLAAVSVVVSTCLLGCAESAESPEPESAQTRTLDIDGRLTFDQRWKILSPGSLSSDPDYRTTTLRVNLLKLDSASDGDAVVRVQLVDGTICKTERQFSVFSEQGGSLFEGQVGYQELTCDHYLDSNQLSAVTSGTALGGE